MTRGDRLFCTFSAFVFLAASLWHPNLPGLQYDECLAAAPAVNFVEGTENSEPMQINPSVIHIFDRPLPAMIMTYIGPVKTILHIPLFALFGISPLTVRLLPILALLACIPLTYKITEQLFERTAAKITVALLVLDPSFVFYATRDVGPAAIQILLKLAAILTFVSWWKNLKTRDFLLGMFFCGLGASHKVDFIWIIGALLFSVTILARKEVLQRLSGKISFLGFASFCFGALPIIVFNVATGGTTFAPILSKFVHHPVGEAWNFVVYARERLIQLAGLLNGEYISSLFMDTGTGMGLLIYLVPGIFFVSFAGLLNLLRRKLTEQDSRAIFGLWLWIGFVFAASCYSPTGLSGHHLLALYPMVHIAMALGLIHWSKRAAAWKRMNFAIAITIVLVIVNGATVVSIYRELSRTGGNGYWSDAIYDLNAYLQKRNLPIVAMEWGFTNNLLVLSQGTLHINRVYAERWKNVEWSTALEPHMNDNTLFLFHTKGFSEFQPAFDAFKAQAELSSREVIEERQFLQRDGIPVYTIFRTVVHEDQNTSTLNIY